MASPCEFSSIFPDEANLPSKSLAERGSPHIFITPPNRAAVPEPSEKPPTTSPAKTPVDDPSPGALPLPGTFPKELAEFQDQDHCEDPNKSPMSSQRSRRSEESVSDVNEQHSVSRGSQGSKRRGSFTIARVTMDKSKSSLDRVAFLEGVEPVMQLYLEAGCADGPSMCTRVAKTMLVVLGLLILVSTTSFWSLVMPFSSPSEGFWANWRFNFLAIPSMMYVVSGSGVLLLFRSISPALRAQMGWKVLWVPIVGPIACVAIQTIAGACGLFPMPYLVLTAAVPAQMVALLAAGLSIPADLMTAEVRRWWMYVTFGFIAYPGQSMLFMLWLAVFPKLTEVLQVLGSFALTSLLAVSAILMERIGMWLALPIYLLYEIKVIIIFVSFVYTAALLSSAKSTTVLLLMLAQDAAKAAAIFLKMCFQLLSEAEAEASEAMEASREGDAGTSSCPTCSCPRLPLITPCELLAVTRQKWSLLMDTRERLVDIFTIFRLHTQDSLQQADLPLADVRLLGCFTRCMVVFGLVELCEVLVPLLYIVLAVMLHGPLGWNREYIYLFKDMELRAALVGNGLGFLIEVLVLLLLQCAVFRLFGFNMLRFVSHVLWTDYGYWISILSTSLLGWVVVLLSHGGHDLEAIEDWLSL